MSDNTQEDNHTGPIKTPKQLLATVFFAFVVPVAIIMGLVAYVSSEFKPAGSTETESFTLGGVTAQDIERGTTDRIRKVGTVEIRDANRPLQSGENVFKAQCTTCHSAGVAGAPKFGDAAAWAARIKTGFEALVNSALKGKGAMPPQGGGDFNDTEIARAVAYMANAAGGKFQEPAAPQAGAQQAAASAPAASAPAAAAPASAPAAAAQPAAQTVAVAPAAAPAPAAAAGNGEAVYKQFCVACHAAYALGTFLEGTDEGRSARTRAAEIATRLEHLDLAWRSRHR